jgi:chromosome segregation ATPase
MAATAAVAEVETKLGPLAELQELSKSTDERLAALNVLAEHVSHKIKALESQKHAIDHAAVQTNRLNEMVWSMDVQINKLAEGGKQVQRAEDTLARMEQLAVETEAHLGSAMATREDFSREFARLEQDSRALTEYLKHNVERLAVEKKEFDAFDHRLKALQNGIADAEGRMDSLLARDQAMSALAQRVDAIGKDFQALGTQADALALKQTTLESLGERLADVDALSQRLLLQQGALLKSRGDLERMREEVHGLHQSHADAARLVDTLAQDRAALEAFAGQATELLVKAPELESLIADVLGMMGLVDEGTWSATKLVALAAELDGHLARVSARSEFIEKLETRINGLHVVTAEVDRKIGEQLARRHELDSLQNALDGVSTQVVDTQQKLDGVEALQQKIAPLAAHVELQSLVNGAGFLLAMLPPQCVGLAQQFRGG